MLTLESRKEAFQSTWVTLILTMILCWIICWFVNVPYAAMDVTLSSCSGANGLSCFITPIIGGIINYFIMKHSMTRVDKGNTSSDPKLEKNSLEEQLIFFHWIPKNCAGYLIFFSACMCVFFGFGLPTLLDFCIPITVKAGVGSRIFVTLIGGIQIGFSAQMSAYLSAIYFPILINRKSAQRVEVIAK